VEVALKLNLCPICQNEKTNPQNKTCSRHCAIKYQWRDKDRLEKHKITFNPNISIGRPKGSKNKNPYPMSPAVLKRIEENKHYLLFDINPMQGRNHTEESKEKMSNSQLERFSKGDIKQVGTMQGLFKAKHPEKYLGNPTNIVYRSSWEFRVMLQLDHDPNVIGWASEEMRIPYKSPLDNRYHSYFPDFLVKERLTNGKIRTKILEVKPYSQTLQPQIPSVKSTDKKKQKRFFKEVQTYAVNQAKWESARKFCKNNDFDFVILTENELFGRKK